MVRNKKDYSSGMNSLLCYDLYNWKQQESPYKGLTYFFFKNSSANSGAITPSTKV